MKRSGLQTEGHIIQRVAQPLNRPVEIRGRRIREEKMLKALWNQTPATDQRVAQYERLVVPDEIVPHDGRVRCTDQQRNEDEWSETSQTGNRVDRLINLRV